MKQGIFRIKENIKLTPTTYRMRLEGGASELCAPGQFINIKLGGHFLRRPISVCDMEDLGGGNAAVTIIYKVLGHGTEEMSLMSEEAELDVLTGLGNGYDLGAAGDAPLLIGGGVGVPPLYFAAKELTTKGSEVTALLGFNSADEIYYADEFERLGCKVIISTVDGSKAVKGFVTDAFKEAAKEAVGEAEFTYFYACGPEGMLRAVYKDVYEGAGLSGEMSFEERMGCGFGACMGCSTKTKDGYKRICKDGPVLKAEEILWQ